MCVCVPNLIIVRLVCVCVFVTSLVMVQVVCSCAHVCVHVPMYVCARSVCQSYYSMSCVCLCNKFDYDMSFVCVTLALINCGDAWSSICVTNKVNSMTLFSVLSTNFFFFQWILDLIQMQLSLCTAQHKLFLLPDYSLFWISISFSFRLAWYFGNMIEWVLFSVCVCVCCCVEVGMSTSDCLIL